MNFAFDGGPGSVNRILMRRAKVETVEGKGIVEDNIIKEIKEIDFGKHNLKGKNGKNNYFQMQNM
ncbi:hypothetical protein [Paucisalibacillus globulus]|uniref:hypothetical protein n=1 Tax=Paucisalibacillus globulus TaxID=351095 RepID=UPI00316AD340